MFIVVLGFADVLVLVQMLDDLLVAVESETQVVDIGRVSGFMQKVKSTQAPLLGQRQIF
jgi:hypothetical protein